MIPEASVGDNLPGGKLGEALQENYREVVNVGASLFNSPKTPHLGLKELYAHPDAFPVEVKSVLNNSSGRMDFKAELARLWLGPLYAICVMTFLALAHKSCLSCLMPLYNSAYGLHLHSARTRFSSTQNQRGFCRPGQADCAGTRCLAAYRAQ